MIMYRQKTVATGVAFVFFLAMGVMFRVDPVLADEEDEEEFAAAIEEVRVEAPVITRKVTARGPSGYTTEVIQLRRQVSYADLDLTDERDVEEFEKRIEMSAREACKALKELFPKGQKNAVDVYRCTKHAIENSEESFESVVAIAN
jgi:UrcA family protein